MIASHNLRTPLTIIDGYLELAKSEALSADLQHILSNIETNSKRLKIFAEDLLIISSVEAGQKVFKMNLLAIEEILHKVADDFKEIAANKQIDFRVEIPSDPVKIRGSNVHIRNAIYNLLDNAFKFTKEKGSIRLKMVRLDDTIQISVADTGAGIPPKEIEKLFTKFHRGTSTLEYNYEGTGIGLYLTKLIVNEHGGTIDVQSEVGKGSTFTITLPLTPPE
jgi:signal transduction histidine kinase